jgi:hypothetical protein
MPLKLSIASSRKIGEPNYGSRGATVGLEMEVDSSLVDNPRQLHERIRRLFRLAKQSVDLELGSPLLARKQLDDPESIIRPATDRQIRAIQAIAGRRSLDLTEVLRGRFGIERPEDLSLNEASQLIDAIKPSANGAADQTSA